MLALPSSDAGASNVRQRPRYMPLLLGQRVDALDASGTWVEARVLAFGTTGAPRAYKASAAATRNTA